MKSVTVLLAGLLLAVVVLASWLGFGLVKTRASLTALQRFDLTTAQTQAEGALRVVDSFNLLSANQLPDLRAWQTGLELIVLSPQLLSSLSQTVADPQNHASVLPQATTLATELKQQLQSSFFIPRLFPAPTAKALAVLDDIATLEETVLSDHFKILIVFQNSHELRATGGFIGSYAIVQLHQGQLQSIEVQDIYVPDGQFKGYVHPPAGVDEYLSGGQGLRLPDANWWPDFPASARQILAYFALGKESDIDAVVAVNLEVAEQVVAIVGETFIPDYQLTITPANLATMLRTQRDEFFPGSISKQHVLTSVFNQLKFKLSELSSDQQRQLLSLILMSAQHKQLQFYSNQENLQQLFQKYGVAGQITAQAFESNSASNLYLFLVESNVGINKANKAVQRQVTLEMAAQTTQLTITFDNTNPATSSAAFQNQPDKSPHYANYQRILITPEVQITDLAINHQPIAKWDREVITTNSGESFQQIGFFVPIPAEAQTIVTAQLHHPTFPPSPQIFIQKQAGLPPTHYRLRWHNQTQDIWLTQDSSISF